MSDTETSKNQIQREIAEILTAIRKLEEAAFIEYHPLTRARFKAEIEQLEMRLTELGDDVLAAEQGLESAASRSALPKIESQSRTEQMLDSIVVALARGIHYELVGTAVCIGIVFAMITGTFPGFLLGLFATAVFARGLGRI